ncbi:MAG: hypothetical protein IPP71_07965 [Bacteroidetes bacterium]|nr:hypothetical protein [Bacteroidota bacterium]
MIDRIPFRFAVKFMMILIITVLVFHTLIITGIIPYSVVWGGKLKNADQMYLFETGSIVMNMLLLVFIAVKAHYVKIRIPSKIITGLLWSFVVLFSLNTVGNLFAETNAETFIFTPLTFITAVLIYRIVKEPTDEK